MESISPKDTAPEPISSFRKVVVFDRVVDLIKDGKMRKNGDGRTATYQLDSLRDLTCRVIYKASEEYSPGIHVTHTERLAEFEDGSFVELTRQYSIPKGYDPFVIEFYSYKDEDEDEIASRPVQPNGMSEEVWEWKEDERESGEDEFAGRFVRSIFNISYFEEVMGYLAEANYANMVTPDDEVKREY